MNYCILSRNRWLVADIYVPSGLCTEFLYFHGPGFFLLFLLFYFWKLLLKKRAVIIVLNRIAELCLSCIKQYIFLFYYSQMLRLPAVHSSPVHYTIRPETNHFASEKSIDIRHGTSKRIAFSKDIPQAQLCGKCIVDCAWSCLFWNLCSHGKQRVEIWFSLWFK